MKKLLSTNKEERNRYYFQSLLIIIILLVYSFSINYPIFNNWDDQINILYNRRLSFTFNNIIYWFSHKCVGVYLPITMLSYMVDYSIWGLDSFGYHLQNIFWHIVTVLAIYNCFRLFNIKPWITFFLCLIFAVHPQRIESVVWLSERKDVLCASFYFLSIYFYIKSRDTKFSIIAFLFFILSMLSKPMAVSLPIVLFLYEFYRSSVKSGKLSVISNQTCPPVLDEPRRKSEVGDQKSKIQHSTFKIKHPAIFRVICKIRGSKFFELWPYFLVIILFIPITIITQTDIKFESIPVSIYDKLYSTIYNIYWYFKGTLIPGDLNPLYPTISFLYSATEVVVFYVAGFTFIIILFIKHRTLFIYKVLPILLCFIISLLPVVGLIRLGVIDHADRYSYIPSVFIWFLFGIFLTKFLYPNAIKEHEPMNKLHMSFLCNKKFVIYSLVLYSGLLIINNIEYQKIWENEFNLFSYSTNRKPNNFVAIIHLIDMEFERNNNRNILILADKLRSRPDLELIADYFKSLVMYTVNKKAAVESMIVIEPSLREGIKFQVIHSKYINLLTHIVAGYEFLGNNEKVLEYLNKLMSLPKISNFTLFTAQGLKEYYLNNYKKSTYWYKKALVIKPNNRFVMKRLILNKSLKDK